MSAEVTEFHTEFHKKKKLSWFRQPSKVLFIIGLVEQDILSTSNLQKYICIYGTRSTTFGIQCHTLYHRVNSILIYTRMFPFCKMGKVLSCERLSASSRQISGTVFDYRNS